MDSYLEGSGTTGSLTEGIAARPQSRASLAATGPLLLAGVVLARAAVAARIGLLSDEAYYWEWSRRLAFSYFDHPPMVAWVIRLSTALFGQSPWAVHLPAMALALGSALLLRHLTLELFPGRTGLAWAAAVTLQLVPLFGLGAVFTTPDAPLGFCWLLTLALAWRALHSARADGSPGPHRTGYWYLAGASAGLGLLSKYNMVLLPAALLVFVATSPAYRFWLRRKEPYLACALMLLLFAPVLLWNGGHDWASFRFHLHDRHARPFQPFLDFGRFLLAQLTLTPLLLGVCLWGAGRAWRRGRADPARWYLLCAGVTVLAFFAGVSFFAFTLANWWALAYVPLLVLGLDVMAGLRARALAWATMGMAAVATGLFYLQAATSLFPLPRALDFTAELHGLPQLGERLSTLVDPERGDFVYAHRFQFAALAAFYGPRDAQVTRLGGRYDQYDTWRPEQRLEGRDAVYLCDEKHHRPPETFRFEACESAGELPVHVRSRRLRTFYFWRCRNYLGL